MLYLYDHTKGPLLDVWHEQMDEVTFIYVRVRLVCFNASKYNQEFTSETCQS